MNQFRPFRLADSPWTLLGIAFGFLYGALFILLVDFWGAGILLLVVLGLPIIAVQIALTIGLERFLRRRSRDRPAPPPTAWLRHHSISIGAVFGALGALTLVLFGGAQE